MKHLLITLIAVVLISCEKKEELIKPEPKLQYVVEQDMLSIAPHLWQYDTDHYTQDARYFRAYWYTQNTGDTLKDTVVTIYEPENYTVLPGEVIGYENGTLDYVLTPERLDFTWTADSGNVDFNPENNLLIIVEYKYWTIK